MKIENNIKSFLSYRLAFTLIELLVVIAIIGILSGLIVVAMGGVTTKANIAKAQIFSNSLKNSLMMNIVGEWKFDSITGTIGSPLADETAVADSWSTNNGKTSGGPTLKSGTDCVSGQCLSFDGGDYVDIGSDASLQITTTGTLSVWIKTTAVGVDQGLQVINKRYANADCSPTVRVSNGTTGIVLVSADCSGYCSSASGTTNIKDGNWHYIVGTFSNGTINIYVDGKLDGTGSWDGRSLSNTTSKWYIGYHKAWNNYYTGLIDEVRIFNAAIPTSQVKEQYYAGLNRLLSSRGITLGEYRQRAGEIASY